LVFVLALTTLGGAGQWGEQRAIAAAELRAGAPAKQDESALAAARAWLEELAAGDDTQLAAKSKVPFTFGTTARQKKCDRTAANEGALASLFKCIREQEATFVGELRSAGKLKVRVVNHAHVPRKLAKLVKGHGRQLVSTFVNGDGISFDVVLAVSPAEAGASPAVGALYVDGEVEAD